MACMCMVVVVMVVVMVVEVVVVNAAVELTTTDKVLNPYTFFFHVDKILMYKYFEIKHLRLKCHRI